MSDSTNANGGGGFSFGFDAAEELAKLQNMESLKDSAAGHKGFSSGGRGGYRSRGGGRGANAAASVSYPAASAANSLSPSAAASLNNTDDADIVSTNYCETTAAEAAKGAAAIAAGLERFTNKVKKAVSAPTTANSNAEPTTTANATSDSASSLSVSSIAEALMGDRAPLARSIGEGIVANNELKWAKKKKKSDAKNDNAAADPAADIILIPVYSAIEATVAYIHSNKSAIDDDGAGVHAGDASLVEEKNTSSLFPRKKVLNKVLFIEPAAKIVSNTKSQFVNYGVPCCSAVTGLADGSGAGAGAGAASATADTLVIGGGQKGVYVSTALEVTMVLKRWIRLMDEREQKKTRGSANNKKAASPPSSSSAPSSDPNNNADDEEAENRRLIADLLLSTPLGNFDLLVVERAYQMSIETQALLCTIREILRLQKKHASDANSNTHTKKGQHFTCPPIPTIVLSVSTPQQARVKEYFCPSSTRVAILPTSTTSSLSIVNCHEATAVATEAAFATSGSKGTRISTVRVTANVAQVQAAREAMKAAKEEAKKQQKKKNSEEGDGEAASSSSSSDEDEIDATPEASALAIAAATARINGRFLKNACENVLPPLLTQLGTSAITILRSTAATNSSKGSSPPAPLIVIYGDTSAPAFKFFYGKLAAFQKQMQAAHGVTVKWCTTIADAEEMLRRDAAYLALSPEERQKKTGIEVGGGAAAAAGDKSYLYLLVINSASRLTVLESLANVALVGVIDFGTSTTLSMDGDKNNKLNKQKYSGGSNPLLTSMLLRQVDGSSPVAFQSCDWASQEQIEMRALSADGGLYIQLIPEEVVRPTAVVSASATAAAASVAPTTEDSTRAVVLPTSLLPPVAFSPASSRGLLSLLRCPVRSNKSFFFAPDSFIYPMPSTSAMAHLKSLGLIAAFPSSSNAPAHFFPTISPTVLGELVASLPADPLNCEAGVLIVLLASMGLPELAAAAGVSCSRLSITSRSDLARADFTVKGAEGSDVIADANYFLNELKYRFEKSETATATAAATAAATKEGEKATTTLKPYTNGKQLAAAIDLYKKILSALKMVAFIGANALAAEGGDAANSKKKSGGAGFVGKAPSATLADLAENTLLASAIVAATFASNAVMVAKNGTINPLFFKPGGERQFEIVSLSAFSAASTTASADAKATPYYASLVDVTAPASAPNSGAATAITNKIVVPLRFIKAPTPRAKSVLVSNTVMPASLFFAAVTALRPVLSCLLDGTMDPMGPSPSPNTSTFRLTIHGRSYFSCSHNDANKLLSLRSALSTCVQLLEDKRSLLKSEVLAAAKASGMNTVAAVNPAAAVAASAASAGGDSKASTAAFIAGLRTIYGRDFDFADHLSNTRQSFYDTVAAVTVADTVKYDSINSGLSMMLADNATEQPASAGGRGRGGKSSRQRRGGRGGRGARSDDGPIIPDPYTTASFGAATADSASPSPSSDLVEDAAIPFDCTSMSAALANASLGRLVACDIKAIVSDAIKKLKTEGSPMTIASSADAIFVGGCGGEANAFPSAPATTANPLLGGVGGIGLLQRPPPSGEAIARLILASAEADNISADAFANALQFASSHDENNMKGANKPHAASYGAYFFDENDGETTADAFANRGPLIDDDDE